MSKILTKRQLKANVQAMTIDMNALQLKQRKFTTSEIGRGVGVQAAKKGKGSYSRNRKEEGEEAYCKTT